MLRKSVLGAVCATNGALAATARRIVGQQHRSFTSTSQRSANITHFTPTSSPELDSLLNDIRTKIILPHYLPEAQRKRIYSPKWEKKLQADPVTIEIDGEVLKFGYQTDIPNVHRTILQAIRQFETPADFANLKPLLEGIKYTGHKFSPNFYIEIMRVVGVKGHVFDIFDCARSVRRTGYKLDDGEKVNEMLHFLQMTARDADWDEAQTTQALRWVEMVIEMLQDEAHKPKLRKDKPVLPGELPLNRDPMVLAAPLHLAAVLVAQHEAGEEVQDKVHKLARDVVALWPEGTKLKEVQRVNFPGGKKVPYLARPSTFAAIATPLLHGLDTAIKVVEPELAGQLQTRRDTLAADVQEARTLAEEKREERIRRAEANEEATEEQRMMAARETRAKVIHMKFPDT
ncbi:hypothetical protein F4782DRAFT_494196 [Xylaria castorea]|nr:hypothetical protein F4782DRAFT_494196 [Xylaria castorea]